jgi:hypothetical protein
MTGSFEHRCAPQTGVKNVRSAVWRTQRKQDAESFSATEEAATHCDLSTTVHAYGIVPYRKNNAPWLAQPKGVAPVKYFWELKHTVRVGT